MIKEITGEMRSEMGEEPPARGRIMRMRIIVPYWCMIVSNSLASEVGRSPPRIFSPSRGKTGTRLKMASMTLREISTWLIANSS